MVTMTEQLIYNSLDRLLPFYYAVTTMLMIIVRDFCSNKQLSDLLAYSSLTPFNQDYRHK